jgi:hypothetical protein
MNMIRVKTIAILLIAFVAFQPKAWGQSGSWADNTQAYTPVSTTTILIQNAGQLAKLAAVVNGGADLSGYTIQLDNDIDLSAHYWVPIGTATHPFNGTFSGGSHTVSGLNINDGTLDNAGLFGYASGATISNLTVSAGSIVADENVGVLAGSLYSSNITSCSVSATSISGTRNVSALVGYCDWVSGITSCTVTGTTAVSLANNTDNNSTLSGCQNKPCDVTLSNHTFYKDGKWNTICLPFDYDPAYGVLAGDGVEIYTLTSANIDGTRLNLFFGENVAGNGVMRAGTPYIIKWNNTGVDLKSPVFQGVVPRVTDSVEYDNKAAGDARVRFRGTLNPVLLSADQSILFMGANNTLYYPSTAITMGACRAYFKIGEDVGSASVRQMESFDFTFDVAEENVAGIITTTSDRGMMPDVWYTLDGRKLDKRPTQKGIYIFNGKKGVIK